MNDVADNPQAPLSRLRTPKISDLRSVQLAGSLVLALVVARLILAAMMPLAADEAYYWLWSKHLSAGYYDHPPAVAFVIRAGTLLAGDNEFGIRLVSVLLAVPMSWAVFRAAYPGATDDERCRRQVIAFVRIDLEDEPSRSSVIGKILERELDGHLAKSSLRQAQ